MEDFEYFIVTHWRRVVGVIILLTLFLVVYLWNNTYDAKVMVNALTWVREQQVERFSILHQDTSDYLMPADAYNVYRYTTTSSHTREYSCGTSKSPEICTETYYTTDYRARYDINRWVYDYSLYANGTYKDEVIWPEYKSDFIDGAPFIGQHRSGARIETYTIGFKRTDDSLMNYSVSDIMLWRTFGIEQWYQVSINRFEQPFWTTLKKGV